MYDHNKYPIKIGTVGSFRYRGEKPSKKGWQPERNAPETPRLPVSGGMQAPETERIIADIQGGNRGVGDIWHSAGKAKSP